jgi:tetratricopeptide (TPR) repeat protein
MEELTNIEQANENSWLWPSIADAVDTFLRRRDDSDAYERIWRLIHIWESIATTLSGAASAQLRNHTDTHQATFLKVREHLYGVSYDKIDSRLKVSQGAFDGINDKRIEILRVIQKTDQLPTEFLRRLKAFLSWPKDVAQESEDQEFNKTKKQVFFATSLLLDTWKRVCDVPSGIENEEAVTVINLVGLVNTFRNRYAHVPFPYDPIEQLAHSLELLTESLFSVSPRASKFDSVLAGGIVYRTTLWRGGLPTRWRDEDFGESYFVFPPYKPQERWAAGPFVYIDPNKRPYVLTRLRNRETGTWEYTRFRAEANAVVADDAEQHLSWIPTPHLSEYKQPEDQAAVVETDAGTSGSEVFDQAELGIEPKQPIIPVSIAPAKSFSEAIEAMRLNEYDSAIPFFESLVEARPGYHIGWLRLGHAQREKAARLGIDQREEALSLIDSSINSFTQALGHVDPEYRASAHYERSKSYYRRLVFANQKSDAEHAIEDASTARKYSSDSNYQTWLEYLERAVRQWIKDAS